MLIYVVPFVAHGRSSADVFAHILILLALADHHFHTTMFKTLLLQSILARSKFVVWSAVLYSAIQVAVLGKVILCVGAVVPMPINHAVSMNKDELVLQDFWFLMSKVESPLLGEFVLVTLIDQASLLNQDDTPNTNVTASLAPHLVFIRLIIFTLPVVLLATCIG